MNLKDVPPLPRDDEPGGDDRSSCAGTATFDMLNQLSNDACADKNALREAIRTQDAPPRETQSRPNSAMSDGGRSSAIVVSPPDERPTSPAARSERRSVFEDDVCSYKSSPRVEEVYESRHREAPPLPAKPPPLPAVSASADRDDFLEKQDALMELQRLQKAGVQMTRAYTIADDLSDIQFEVRRQQVYMDEVHAVRFMKDVMRMTFTGIEMANGRVGPFLDLDGWSVAVASDIDRYDHALSRIYKRYWRKSTSAAPEMELAFGIIGSMAMFHFRKKLHGLPLNSLAAMVPPPAPKPAPRPPPKAPPPVDYSDDECEPP